MAQTDEQLVREIQAGRAGGLPDELVRRHIGRIRALVRQMTLNEADADDLTQEVFIKAFQGLAGFEGRSRFATWLTTIALNTARSFLTRRAKAPVRTGDVESPGDRLAASDDTVLFRELDAEIEAALAALSPPLRAAFVLTTLHDTGIAEVARIEGCSIATVYWRVHEARKILKARLRRYLKP
jgi:RNA polymerase sigma-70 factor (ECF subfamily)